MQQLLARKHYVQWKPVHASVDGVMGLAPGGSRHTPLPPKRYVTCGRQVGIYLYLYWFVQRRLYIEVSRVFGRGHTFTLIALVGSVYSAGAVC